MRNAPTLDALYGMFQNELDRYYPRMLRFPALLVDIEGTGSPEVANRPGYVYYRRAEDEDMYGVCQNRRVPNRVNMPVFVGYDIHQPNLLQVLSIRNVWGGTGQTLPPDIAPHHETHELNNDNGGDDVVWVNQQQIINLLCLPAVPEDMTVVVNPGQYGHKDGFAYYTGATTADLSSYKPSSPTQGKFVALSVDVETNALQYTEGDTFGIISTPANIWQYIPEMPDGSVPVAAILLVSTTTSLGWDQIYDIRAINRSVRDQKAVSLALQSIPRLESDIDATLSFMRKAIADVETSSRTRKLFVQVTSGTIYPASWMGAVLANGVVRIANGCFIVPEDYLSGMSVVPVIITQTAGDVYYTFTWAAATDGEIITDESVASGWTTAAVSDNGGSLAYNFLPSLSIAAVAKGDVCLIYFSRDASDVSDTCEDTIYFPGWIVQYTADM